MEEARGEVEQREGGKMPKGIFVTWRYDRVKQLDYKLLICTVIYREYDTKFFI